MSNHQPYQNPQPHANISTPKIQLPRNSTDCHCHLFEDPAKYPLSSHPSYLPPNVTISDYLNLINKLGIDRAVISTRKRLWT
jgi:predicted TIM-barrel fold metal-dependent hydrolase